MFGPDYSEANAPKAETFNGHCYDCEQDVEVVHIKSKGQYVCSECGGFETRLV